MSTNQKYSTRLHTRRQLSAVNTHLTRCTRMITDVGMRYEEVLPEVSLACCEMMKLLEIINEIVVKIRDGI